MRGEHRGFLLDRGLGTAAAIVVVVSSHSIGSGLHVIARASTSSMRETGTISSPLLMLPAISPATGGELFRPEHPASRHLGRIRQKWPGMGWARWSRCGGSPSHR